MLDPQHGTINEYNHFGCRCDECRKAYSDYMREYRKTYVPGARAKQNQKHGTLSSYSNHKCRCDACYCANSEYQTNYRRKQRG